MDTAVIRSQFPGLQLPYIFLDNPGGTQIARSSLNRLHEYLLYTNSNTGGVFPIARKSDALLEETRAAFADYFNAHRPEEIVFGANMSTLTFSISRSLAQDWKPGDKIVVTRMDHEGNVSPWLRAAEDRGCQVLWVDMRTEDCTLDMASLKDALAQKPRVVAVGYASNAVGSINPVAEITRLAHKAGALVYVDAVQYVPHGPVDVQELDCDFLVCSAYKFYGPHVGILYGKYDILDRLNAYKVRPASKLPPSKYETGTQNHEGIAGALGALEYFEWVGKEFGVEDPAFRGVYAGRRLTYKKAMHAILKNELELSRTMLEEFPKVPGLHIYGITDPGRLEERICLVSFTLAGWQPRKAAEALAEAGINVWAGNFYAVSTSERLGLLESGGMVRIGATSYNTLDEIRRLREALQGMAKN